MKQKFRFFGRFQSKAGTGAVLALAGLLALVVCLSACGTGNNPNGTNLNGTDLFVPDEGKLPRFYFGNNGRKAIRTVSRKYYN